MSIVKISLDTGLVRFNDVNDNIISRFSSVASIKASDSNTIMFLSHKKHSSAIIKVSELVEVTFSGTTQNIEGLNALDIVTLITKSNILT